MFRRLIITAAVLFVLLLIVAASLIYLYKGMLEPVNSAEAETETYQIVDIPFGTTTEMIASILYNEGLIHNELVFRIFVRQHNIGPSLIAGKYKLSPAMSLNQIISIMQSGEVYTETAWFTIPEGFTVEEIADRLADEKLVDGEKFLKLAREPSDNIMASFPFLKDIDTAEINYLLEGYLYPDTYEVANDVDEEYIIMVMLQRMDQIINEAHRKRISEKGFSLHEILTIASLVEREVRVDHERNVVSGVIYNRLAIGQRLQIDATIQYALGENKEFLTYADLEIQSPYNTYLNDGLPPGPIAAPGEPSITAALYPEETDYFYYNYKYDGTGEHYFSRTYQEHLENVRIAEENIR